MVITRRMTPEEFLELPEEKPYLELIDGVVTPKVSPQELHAWIQAILCTIINQYAVPRKLAGALSELRGRFGRDVLLPDVAIYRWERLPRTPDGKLANRYENPPDVAIEIVSPDQSVRALVAKCRRYLASGVPLALVVDPAAEVIVRCESASPARTLRGSDRIDLAPVLPDLELTVQELFETLWDR